MILVAPTAFKGTIGARAAAEAIARGLAATGQEVVVRPLSDGGPGLIDSLTSQVNEIRTTRVTGPLGEPAIARMLRDGDRIVFESADACGLHLVPHNSRDPMRASTCGVGELLRAAIQQGGREVVAGLGGSATVDGGIGFAGALGWRFFDRHGATLAPDPTSLPFVERIQRGEAIHTRVVALADVVSPLTGPDGAARIFGPQKGADPPAVAWLEGGLVKWASTIERETGIAVANLPAGGAAGGLGAAFVAFAGAELVSGSDWVLETVEIDHLLAAADLVITAEGRYDAQSALGKITGTLMQRARQLDKRVLLLAGSVAGVIPEHVTVATNQGKPLTENDLERITRGAVATLLAP